MYARTRGRWRRFWPRGNRLAPHVEMDAESVANRVASAPAADSVSSSPAETDALQRGPKKRFGNRSPAGPEKVTPSTPPSASPRHSYSPPSRNRGRSWVAPRTRYNGSHSPDTHSDSPAFGARSSAHPPSPIIQDAHARTHHAGQPRPRGTPRGSTRHTSNNPTPLCEPGTRASQTSRLHGGEDSDRSARRACATHRSDRWHRGQTRATAGWSHSRNGPLSQAGSVGPL